MNTSNSKQSTHSVPSLIKGLRDNIQSVLLGKNEKIDIILRVLFAGGHILIEDLPGTGKTTLAQTLAKSIQADWNRVQFTPDLLPADVLGGSIYHPAEGHFELFKGPIFTHVFLADEINRASPRTQSALLEAMAESQVSIEGTTHKLAELFMVIATQNPAELHGVFPLPESQMDRFLVRMNLGYANLNSEIKLLFDQQQEHPLESVQSILTQEQVLEFRKIVRNIHVDSELAKHIVQLTQKTRNHPQISVGASPRGSIGLFRMCQATAFLAGREFILPDDIHENLIPVLSHRISLQQGGEDNSEQVADILRTIWKSTPIPR